MEQDINKKIFDEHSANYSREVDEVVAFSGLKADFFTRVKAERLLEYLGDHFGDVSSLKLLDLGCGVGTYETLLNGHVGSVTGIDVSEQSIEKARQNNPQNTYLSYDGRKLPFEDNSFDAVFAICVMHHVPVENWSGFVAEAMRVTRKGGAFAIFEHNPWNPLTQHVVSSCEFDADAVLLTPKKIQKAFDQGGVKQASRKVDYMLAIPPKGGVLKAADKMLSKIAIGAQYAVFSVK